MSLELAIESDDWRAAAHEVLNAAWDPYRGYCFPNADVYPHLWLWDSCFHAIAWGALADRRGVRELRAVFAAQLEDGFVPHMRYAGETINRGPLDFASSFTQPPVFAHAAAFLTDAGFIIDHPTRTHIAGALDWLWTHRRTPSGLLFVVHPWESGADDSPRWDDWVGSSSWDRERWTAADSEFLDAVSFHPSGAAAHSKRFEAAPAGFNALASHAAAEYSRLTGDERWARRAAELAQAIDDVLWNSGEGMWSDLEIVGGGSSVHVPTLDGLLPALVSPTKERALTALDQLRDPDRFRAPFGLSYVARDYPGYEPGQYWRGSSWMQLNYLANLAAHRLETADISDYLADAVRRAALTSRFAEHWNPETGEGYGAVPQSWSALVSAIA